MRKTTATIFIVLICIIMQGCGVAENEPPPYQSKMVYDNGGSTLYTNQLWRLVAEFMRNEVAAKQKYMGKRIAVDGLISSIYSLSNGDPALTLGHISTYFVDCQFPKVFINDIAQMGTGHYVIVIGTVYDYSSSYTHRRRDSRWAVHLKDCILAQPANPEKSQ